MPEPGSCNPLLTSPCQDTAGASPFDGEWGQSLGHLGAVFSIADGQCAAPGSMFAVTGPTSCTWWALSPAIASPTLVEGRLEASGTAVVWSSGVVWHKSSPGDLR